MLVGVDSERLVLPRPNPGPLPLPESDGWGVVWPWLGVLALVAAVGVTAGWLRRASSRRKREFGSVTGERSELGSEPPEADAVAAWCGLVRETLAARWGERGRAMTTAELLKAADHEAFLRDDQRAALARVLGEGERRVYGPPTEEQPAGWPEREILEDLLSALRLRNPEARAGMGDEAASRRVRPG